MPSRISDMEMNETEDSLLKPTVNVVTASATNGMRKDSLPTPTRDGTTPASRMLGDDIPVGVLETMAERRARKRSHYVVYITTFVMSVGFSIVLTGVWPYLQQLDPSVSKQFLGWVVAASPLGQMLASPLFGIWANKAGSNRGAFFATVFAFIVGNILYATLVLFGSAARAVMIFARFVVGVSSANIAIIRSYVAASTTMNERTTAVSLISASQGLGFIFGPAIQTGLVVIFSQSDYKDEGEDSTPSSHNSSAIQTAFAAAFNESENYTTNSSDISNITLNETAEFDDTKPDIWNTYTVAGWFAALLGLVNLCLYLPCIFQEHPIAIKEAQYHKRSANEDGLHHFKKPDYLILIVLLLTFFYILMTFVLIETMLVPMSMDMYAWSDKMAIMVIGIGLSIAGALTVVIFGSIGIISKKIDERKVLIFFGLIPLMLSCFCFFPMGSTYPKMQNCPADTEILNDNVPLPLDSFDPATTIIPPHVIENEGNLTTDSLKVFSSNQTSFEDIYSFDNISASLHIAENESSHKTLSRRRRHVSRDEKCHDLGCPSVQTWCTYTPIIELPQMGIACFIAVLGYPVAFALVSALFSKVLGPRPQGFWMGVLTSTGSFSRVMGPIFVSYVYTMLGPRWTFGILFSLSVCAIIIVSLSYKRLVPMKVEEARNSDS